MLTAVLRVVAAHGVEFVAERLHRLSDRLQGEPPHDSLLEPVESDGSALLSPDAIDMLSPDAIDMLAPPPSLTRPTLVPPPLKGSLADRTPGKKWVSGQ